jgi:hypothetical protein
MLLRYGKRFRRWERETWRTLGMADGRIREDASIE